MIVNTKQIDEIFPMVVGNYHKIWSLGFNTECYNEIYFDGIDYENMSDVVLYLHKDFREMVSPIKGINLEFYEEVGFQLSVADFDLDLFTDDVVDINQMIKSKIWGYNGINTIDTFNVENGFPSAINLLMKELKTPIENTMEITIENANTDFKNMLGDLKISETLDSYFKGHEYGLYVNQEGLFIVDLSNKTAVSRVSMNRALKLTVDYLTDILKDMVFDLDIQEIEQLKNDILEIENYIYW